MRIAKFLSDSELLSRSDTESSAASADCFVCRPSVVASVSGPTLQELIRTALKQNHDLKLATERINAARAQLAVARSGLFPPGIRNCRFWRCDGTRRASRYNFPTLTADAVFQTGFLRPRYGEGPMKVASGSLHDKNTVNYTPEDFRFTTKGDVVYAIGFGWPTNGEVALRAAFKQGARADSQSSPGQIHASTSCDIRSFRALTGRVLGFEGQASKLAETKKCPSDPLLNLNYQDVPRSVLWFLF